MPYGSLSFNRLSLLLQVIPCSFSTVTERQILELGFVVRGDSKFVSLLWIRYSMLK